MILFTNGAINVNWGGVNEMFGYFILKLLGLIPEEKQKEAFDMAWKFDMIKCMNNRRW